MKTRIAAALASKIVVVSALTGCLMADGEPEEGENVGEGASAMLNYNGLNPNGLNPNGLNPNGLNPNGLNPNGLNPNGLNPNGLNPNGLDPDALKAIQDPGEAGELSRLLLAYTVSCAFNSTQSFRFSWTDRDGIVHNEVYYGLIGLAPSWISQPLGLAGQQLVSSCLAARTNWYSARMIISMRSPKEPLSSNTTATEIALYSHIEGAFWGNLFSDTPYLAACYNPATMEYSREHDRDCATGRVNDDGTISPCGMIKILGPCDNYCTPPASGVQSAVSTPGPYYTNCVDPCWGKASYAITVGLR